MKVFGFLQADLIHRPLLMEGTIFFIHITIVTIFIILLLLSSTLHNTIDPFSSSPDTRSMFIDLSSSSDSSLSNTPKLESFLSLTGSSPSNRSSLIFSRRERPTSIQTMPLPSRSRRSSWQYRAPSQEKEKSDFFLILEEEPSLATEGPDDTIHEDHEEWDAPAKIDWHQFHIDLLTDDA